MDAKVFFLKHGEKVALGLAGLLTVIGLVGVAGGGYGDAEKIDGLVERVKVAMKAAPPPLPALGHLEAIQAQWEPVSPVASTTRWAFHKRHYIKRVLEEGPIDDVKRVSAQGDPSLKVLERGVDYLVIECIPDLEDAEVVKVLLFRTIRVDREGNPVFPNLPYKVLKAGDLTFRDTEGIRPRAVFHYRVQVEAKEVDDPLVEVLPEADRVRESASLSVDVPADVYLLPMSVVPGSILKKTPAEASIMVYKWFPDRGKWDDELYRVKVGEPIGEIEEFTGTGDMDFRSGFKLVAAEIRERTIVIAGRPVPKRVFWIKVESIDDPDAPAELFESGSERQKKLKDLKKGNQLIPGESPGGEAGDEEGAEETEDETGSNE